MNRPLFAACLAALTSLPLAGQACTATGYVITVNVHENFPATQATIYVRHPTSTGAVTGAVSFNPTLVAAASAAVSGNQRVKLTAVGGGAGLCPAGLVGQVFALDLRP